MLLFKTTKPWDSWHLPHSVMAPLCCVVILLLAAFANGNKVHCEKHKQIVEPRVPSDHQSDFCIRQATFLRSKLLLKHPNGSCHLFSKCVIAPGELPLYRMQSYKAKYSPCSPASKCEVHILILFVPHNVSEFIKKVV